MVDKFCLLHALRNGLFYIRVASFVQRQAREQVVDQTEEERLIFVHQFAQVHVTQHTHHDSVFAVLFSSNACSIISIKHDIVSLQTSCLAY